MTTVCKVHDRNPEMSSPTQKLWICAVSNSLHVASFSKGDQANGQSLQLHYKEDSHVDGGSTLSLE